MPDNADAVVASIAAEARTNDSAGNDLYNKLTKSAEAPYSSTYRQRDPWIISCESWFSRGKYIALTLNPESLDFNIPLRIASETTHAAKFVYVWRRRRTNDVTNNFTINFQLSSGNIVPAFDISTAEKVELAKKYTGVGIPPKGYAAEATNKGAPFVRGLYDTIVPLGVQNLYSLLALADEYRIQSVYKKIDGKSKLAGQTSNRIVMGISTLALPRMLLYGWFTPEGISVSMSADNPYEFQISFSLLVTSTLPKIGYDGYRQLVSSYKNNMYDYSNDNLNWMASGLNKKLTRKIVDQMSVKASLEQGQSLSNVNDAQESADQYQTSEESSAIG